MTELGSYLKSKDVTTLCGLRKKEKAWYMPTFFVFVDMQKLSYGRGKGYMRLSIR